MIVRISVLLAALVFSPQLWADQAIADKHISNAELVGKARFKVIFWSVFDATLYAKDANFQADQPFALSLSYLRKIEGSEIVASSITEMKAQNLFTDDELSDWEAQLSDFIPDVNDEITITGVRDKTGSSLFYSNGTLIGQIDNQRFTQGFFSIWLGEKTRDKKFRAQLLNLK